jgi:hypothetical protein
MRVEVFATVDGIDRGVMLPGYDEGNGSGSEICGGEHVRLCTSGYQIIK